MGGETIPNMGFGSSLRLRLGEDIPSPVGSDLSNFFYDDGKLHRATSPSKLAYSVRAIGFADRD